LLHHSHALIGQRFAAGALISETIFPETKQNNDSSQYEDHDIFLKSTLVSKMAGYMYLIGELFS